MATQVKPALFGIDVSKAELVCSDGGEGVHALSNTAGAIRAWLRAVPASSRLAIEATGRYHLELIRQAQRHGHAVYLVDGYRLNRYREGVGGRAKTDASDARLLARYLANEGETLKPWMPPPEGYDTLQQLLRRRAVLVKARTALRQSLADLPGLKGSLASLMRRIDRIDALLRRRLDDALRAAGWQAQARRCQRIEGVGPLTATALATLFHRGAFRSSDAFIAFLGLDVRVRDSGRSKGRRRLTKKGDAETRRLLYMAAMTARRAAAWKPFYERCLERGLAPVEALNVLARKLARVAFGLMKNQTDYVPRIACGAT